MHSGPTIAEDNAGDSKLFRQACFFVVVNSYAR